MVPWGYRRSAALKQWWNLLRVHFDLVLQSRVWRCICVAEPFPIEDQIFLAEVLLSFSLALCFWQRWQGAVGIPVACRPDWPEAMMNLWQVGFQSFSNQIRRFSHNPGNILRQTPSSEPKRGAQSSSRISRGSSGQTFPSHLWKVRPTGSLRLWWLSWLILASCGFCVPFCS